MTENLNKSKILPRYVWWLLIQAISAIFFISALSLAFTRFHGDIAPYMNGIIIGMIMISLLLLIPIIATIKTILLAKSGKDPSLSPNISPKWDLFWSIWHILLGLEFLGGIIVALAFFWDYIFPGYTYIVITGGITLFGYGISLVYSSIRVISSNIHKIQGKTHLMMPGVTAFGIIFLLLFPVGGFYYIFAFYVPQVQQSQPMNRGPILFWRGEADTSSTIVVAWDSVEEKNYTLKWGLSSSNLNYSATTALYRIYAPTDDDLSVEDGDPIGFRYYYEITGLQENSTYYYQIPGFSQVAHFRTSAITASKYSFQLLGDNRNSNGIHRQLVTLMNNYPGGFVFNGGDVCNGDKLNEWNEFFNDIRDQANSRPYLIGEGNHESGSNNIFAYYFNYAGENRNNTWYPNRNYFAYNYSNMHILVIDTNNLTTGQMKFIEEDLSRNTGKHTWTIAVFHVPIFSTGGHNYNEDLDHKLMGNFTKYGVDLVLTGHDHHYESFNVSRASLESHYRMTYGSTGTGMIHIVAGGGGVALRTSQISRDIEPWTGETQNATAGPIGQKYFPLGADETNYEWKVASIAVYAEVTYQFCQIDVDGNQLVLTSIRLDGTDIESFHMQK